MRARIHPLRRPLTAEAPLRVPGDKSISHRALLFAALADGESRIAGLAAGADVRSTARCLAQLGVPLLRGDGTPWGRPPRSELASGPDEAYQPPVRPAKARPLPARDPDMGPDDAIVLGGGLYGLLQPVGPLDCGNSGTTLRLLCGILAGAGVEATLIGDASLSRRPMERVAAPLRALGARIETTAGKPPVRLLGGKLSGGQVRSEIASAQVKSAVLLAGLYTEGGDVSFTEPGRSRDHTERMLRFAGVPVVQYGNSASVLGQRQLRPFAFDVPGDLSSAAFLLAAVLAGPEGSAIALEHVGVNPTRVGFLDALACFGVQVKLGFGPDAKSEPGLPGTAPIGDAIEPAARLTLRAQKLHGASLDEDLILRAIDEVPILSVLGALADGPTVIRGASELRVKESDRLAQMAQGLRAMGAGVTELPDGLQLAGLQPGRKLRGAEIDSAHDHRIALAFSIAALAAEGPTTISGAEWADVSYPGFFSLLRRLGAEVELLP